MQWYEILIIVLAVGFVFGVIIGSIVRRKQGKSSCDCGCGNCKSCSACHSERSEES